MSAKGLQKIGGILTKNSSTILTGLSVAGLFTTSIMAVKATPKALKILEEEREYRLHHEEVGNEWESYDPTKLEAIKLTWKCYIPAAVTGLATIACIIGSQSINLRRNAALASLYSLSETALKEYKEKVVEKIGETKVREIKDDIAKDKIVRNPVIDREVVITGHGETLCYDALSGRYFKSDIEQIRRTLNVLSRDLMSDMFIPLNEVYSALDLKGTKLGDMIGWHIDDGLIEPDFSSQLTENGIPCLVLDFSAEPRYMYRDE